MTLGFPNVLMQWVWATFVRLHNWVELKTHDAVECLIKSILSPKAWYEPILGLMFLGTLCRAIHRINAASPTVLNVSKVKIGVFTEAGVEYYRSQEGSPLYRRILKTSEDKQLGEDKVQVFNYAYEPVGRVKFAESRVTSEPDIPGQSIPSVQGEVCTDKIYGSCVRVERSILIAGHTLQDMLDDGSMSLTIVGKAGEREILLSRFKRESRLTAEENKYMSSADLAVAELTEKEWAVLGISAMKAKDFYTRTDARVVVTYKSAEGQLLSSSGRLAPTPKWAIDRGIAYHTANTVSGCSGAPLICVRNGVRKLAGLHISAHPEQDKNVCINAVALKDALTRLGVLTAPTREEIVEKFNLAVALGESKAVDGDHFETDKAQALCYSYLEMWAKSKKERGETTWADETDSDEEENRRLEQEALAGIDDDDLEMPGGTAYMTNRTKTKSKPTGKRWSEAEGVTTFVNGKKCPEAEVVHHKPKPPCAATQVSDETSVCILQEESSSDKDQELDTAKVKTAETTKKKTPAEKRKEARLRAAKNKQKTEQGLVESGDSIIDKATAAMTEKSLSQSGKCPLPGDSKAKRFWAREQGEDPPGQYLAPAPKKVATEQDGRRLINALIDGDPSWQRDAQQYRGETLIKLPCFAVYKNYCDTAAEGVEETDHWVFAETENGRADLIGIGKYNNNNFAKDKKRSQHRESVAAALAESNRLKAFEYVFPPCGPKPVLDSLRAQFKVHHCGQADFYGDDQDGKLVKAFWDIVNENHPTEDDAKSPYIADGFAGFNDVAKGFDSKSSGWSNRWKNKMKKECWEQHWSEITLIVACRLIIRQAYLERLGTWDAHQMWIHYCSDPRDLSTKDEGHAEAKAKAGKWRLIWCSSLIDSMCQSLVHRKLNEACKDAYLNGEPTYHCIGLGHDRMGVKHLMRDVKRTFGSDAPLYGSDKSGWDLSVSRDSLVLDSLRRVYYSPEWQDAIMAECFCNSAHLVGAAGTLILVNRFGITASGVPSTTSQNSFINSLYEKAVGSEKVKSNGDDVLTSSPSNPEALLKYGPRVKPESIIHGTVVFFPYTSFLFEQGKEAKFLNGDKAFAKLLNRPFDEQALQSLASVMRGNFDDLRVLKKIASKAFGIEPTKIEQWAAEDMVLTSEDCYD